MRLRYWLFALLLFIVVGGGWLLVGKLAKPQITQLATANSEAAKLPTAVVASDLTLLLGRPQVYY